MERPYGQAKDEVQHVEGHVRLPLPALLFLYDSLSTRRYRQCYTFLLFSSIHVSTLPLSAWVWYD